LVPAPDLGRESELRVLNGRVVEAMGLPHGMTHFEAFCTQDGWIAGEIAARPPGGHLMPLIQMAYGFDPWEAVVRLHLGQSVSPPASARTFAAVHLLVAAEGVVRSVDGIDEARALPGVTEVHCSVKPGDRVHRRVTVSSSLGRVVACSGNATSIRATLRDAVGKVRIEVLPQESGEGAEQPEP
jgi:biotin carboxylase